MRMMPMAGRALSRSRMPLVRPCARRSAPMGATRERSAVRARCAPSVLDAAVSITVPVCSRSPWISRIRPCEAFVGEDREVERRCARAATFADSS